MVDGHANGGRKRSPVLDLNQALIKEDEEEEEQHQEFPGPSWLLAKPQIPWLQLHDQDQGDLKERTSVANPNYLSLEQNRALPAKPFPHVGDLQGSGGTSTLLLNEQHDHGLHDSSLDTEERFQVIDIWKTNSDRKSDATVDLTKSFALKEDVTRSQDKPTILDSLGTMWVREQAALPDMRRSLSPVSPPPRRKSLSPVSPEQRLPEEISGAALRSGRSPGKRGSSFRSPPRGRNSVLDAISKRRREREDSISPRAFSKRRRDRSPSVSPVGRSSRVGRSRSRSPVSRGHRYSPPRSTRYSPRARHSPRRRSPITYRPKRRPWSPPPNRNTGLGKPGRNLFIAGFSFGTTERDLERKFSRYGHVRDVRIVRDRRSGDSRGFGFLSLDRDENADAAIRGLDQTEWNGRIVLVEKAKSPN